MKQAIAYIVQFSWMFFVVFGIGYGTQPWFGLDYHIVGTDSFGEFVHSFFIIVLIAGGMGVIGEFLEKRGFEL